MTNYVDFDSPSDLNRLIEDLQEENQRLKDEVENLTNIIIELQEREDDIFYR